MKIYNENKTQELNADELNYELGCLKDDKRITAHHDAVPARTVEAQIAELKAQGVEIEKHYDKVDKTDKFYRIKAVYANGGKDVEEIKEIPTIEEYDDYEDIQVYIPFTEAELKERAARKRSAELKAELIKVKEDIEQVEFGLVRDDFAEKKARAAEIINELRVLEGKQPREIRAQIL